MLASFIKTSNEQPLYSICKEHFDWLKNVLILNLIPTITELASKNLKNKPDITPDLIFCYSYNLIILDSTKLRL